MSRQSPPEFQGRETTLTDTPNVDTCHTFAKPTQSVQQAQGEPGRERCALGDNAMSL